MKKLLTYASSLLLLIGLGVGVARDLNAKMPDIIRIEVGEREKSGSNSEMQYRVWMLERAVAQLQARVFELELGKSSNTPESQMTTCYIRTPFDGTFTATEATETAAKAKAMEKCAAKANSIHCSERDAKCGK